MVPLTTHLWNWDSRLRDFPKVTREGTEPSCPTEQPRDLLTLPAPLSCFRSALLNTLFPHYYSSWQTLDACSVQHWAHTGYRNIRSSYWLGSNWGKFFFRQFTGLCMLSIFVLYYSASNLLHRYKEETADPTQLIDNLIQSVSSFIRTCKTQ